MASVEYVLQNGDLNDKNCMSTVWMDPHGYYCVQNVCEGIGLQYRDVFRLLDITLKIKIIKLNKILLTIKTCCLYIFIKPT